MDKCLAPNNGPLSLKIFPGIPNLANVFFRLLTTQVTVVCPSCAISKYLKVGNQRTIWNDLLFPWYIAGSYLMNFTSIFCILGGASFTGYDWLQRFVICLDNSTPHTIASSSLSIFAYIFSEADSDFTLKVTGFPSRISDHGHFLCYWH